MLVAKRWIIMDITKIKRRERRFYRKEEEGNVVYADELDNKETAEKPAKVVLEATPKNGKLTSEEKQRIIDKILTDMKNTINPDIDEIADMIYSQLSIKDTNITQETVKQVVENNAHHRYSRRDRGAGTESKTSTREGIKGNYDFLNDRKELEVVIDDIVEENQKEDIRAKDKKEKEKAATVQESKTGSKTKESSKNRKEKKESETDSKKEEPTTAREPSKTGSEEPKVEKKKELKLNFGDDEDVGSEEKSGDEDELGLKF